MTVFRFIIRSLAYRWRTQLGVFLGTLVAAAILTGSLLVGDSVRFSLEQMARSRLGGVVAAVPPGEHFFRERLAEEVRLEVPVTSARSQAPAWECSIPGGSSLLLDLQKHNAPEENRRLEPPRQGRSQAGAWERGRESGRGLPALQHAGAFLGAPNASPVIAPVLMLRATVSLPDGRARANEVELIGVDRRFWQLAPTPAGAISETSDSFIANDRLASQLGLKPGDAVIIRVEKPSLLSRDAPLSGAAENTVAIRARLTAVAGPDQFGRFSLRANQVPPLTVFVPLRALQEAVGKQGCANALMAGGAEETALNAALRKVWDLADLNLEVRDVPAGAGFGRLAELRSERVFLDPALATSATAALPGASGVLTYLVNEIRLGSRATPYSMVTAVGEAPGSGANEIVIDSWLAADLNAKPGDDLALRYFAVGVGRQLTEQTAHFRVGRVFPLNRPSPEWMPPFPGLAEVDNCRDWEPGIPIDTTRIRPKDEEYWRVYRGTPKAFISLRAGQALWSNRFGNLTALRFPMAGGETAREVARRVRDAIDPRKSGLYFQPVLAAALKAGRESDDFGMLFVSLSFFLIAAALLLTALLFVFNIERRTAEAGLLLALGFTRGRVRRLLFMEGVAVAVCGTFFGAVAGTLYTRLALHGLSTVWKQAIAAMEFHYHAEPWTLAVGTASSLAAALLAMWFAARSHARRTPSDLLAGGGIDVGQDVTQASRLCPGRRCALGTGGTPVSQLTAVACLAGALILLSLAGRSPAAFFGAGALLLITGIALAHLLLLRLAGTTQVARSLAAFGIRAAARRRGRTLTVVAVLASGIFMVVSVGAFREDPLRHARERTSGTGGFALFGRSALPVYEDLNTRQGRKALGLSTESMRGVRCVPLRFKEGDEASCLNLNRAQQPQFLGVGVQEAPLNGAFSFIETRKGALLGSGWDLLDPREPDGAVPAVGDEGTVRWALGKGVGDTLDCTDERGNPFRVRIVGMIADSILQGSLVIPEEAFIAHFPSAGGYRVFLWDAPSEKAGELAGTLSAALQERGSEIVPAWRRLAEFQAVENSYLSIFQTLGGLGLLLGSVGLGIVVARNVIERRNELALLRAVGFSPSAIRRLVVSEHWCMIALGVGIGGTAAVIAVLPSLLKPGAHVAGAETGLTIGALAAAGAAWSWLAAWAATRGPLMDALRNE